MQFEEKSFEDIGQKCGFVFSYFIFTTLLFAVFALSHNLHGLTYFHIMGITLVIVIVGMAVKRFLQ
jgi:hypothetical protein